MDQLNSGVSGRPLVGLSPSMDRKRLVLAVRSMVILTAGYLALGETGLGPNWASLAILAFAVSHGLLILQPRERFDDPRFGPVLLLLDSGLILLCLSWGHVISQDLMLVYFFTVFLVSIGESVGHVALGSALVAGLYAYWLSIDHGFTTAPTVWARVPFFFLIGVFYSSLIQQLKAERRMRTDAEFESRQLRLLVDLAGAFSEKEVTGEFVRGMGRFVEGTCEGVTCRVSDTEVASAPEAGAVAFSLRSRGESFGSLVVDTSARGPLTDREVWICQIVAHTAAGALYSAVQSDEAVTASRTKDEFLATVSHEFRTPLHAILGYLEILDSLIDKSGDPLIEESIGRMRVNGCRLKNLLEELLIFAELRAGYGRVVAESVSVPAIFEELGRYTREQVAEKPVTVSWQVDAAAETMITDRRKILQALSGLLSNAAKFTEKGRIHASARLIDGNAVELSVSDTGIGIASSDLALVFDDFRQVDGSFTRRYGGLGVGLPLVRELASVLGGRLEVESDLGKGTTVQLLLPLKVAGGAIQVNAGGHQPTQTARRAPADTEKIRRVG